ncbi:MAG: GtrA family protein [Candidatus Moraniibacteriota bacterium]
MDSNTPLTNSGQATIATKSDYQASIVAGLLIGLLALPILSTTLSASLYGKIWPIVIVFFLVASPAGIFIASKLNKTIPVIWQVAKFTLVGGLNALVDIGILAALQSWFQSTYGIYPQSILLHIGSVAIAFYVLYKTISFLVANFNSFFWNKYWTFSGHQTEKSGEQLVQFLIVSVIGFLINIFFTSFIFSSVTTVGGMNPSQWGLLCAVFGSLAGLAWNFVGYKLFVFKK